MKPPPPAPPPRAPRVGNFSDPILTIARPGQWCHYCKVNGARFEPATRIAHDRRGCVPVCAAHGAWRETTSRMPGHDPTCKSP